MKTLKMYQVDAFADRLFTGNPAAVVVLDSPLDEELMQRIAAENNLSETAFIFPRWGEFVIRWFTPTVEVALCGHATLASACVIFEELGFDKEEITFISSQSGVLRVYREKNQYFLDFPADKAVPIEVMPEVEEAIGARPLEMFRGKTDLLVVVENEETVRNLKPDFQKIKALEARGVIVTAKGETEDFVSRFFAPNVGVDEDPVTGSAHTVLIPFWAERLEFTDLSAAQLSARGGKLIGRNREDRVHIGGEAKLYLRGEIIV